MRLNLLFRSNEPNNSKRHKLHALRKDGGHGFVFADETESEPRPTDNYHPAGRHGASTNRGRGVSRLRYSSHKGGLIFEPHDPLFGSA